MTDSQQDIQKKRIRWLLRISGAVLWILAFIGLYTIWQARSDDARPDNKSSASSGHSKPLRSPQPTEDTRPDDKPSASSPDIAQPKPQKQKKEQPKQIWDPDGIQDFELTERSGRKITKQDLLGQPWVVGFIFTRCAGPCPRVTGQMNKLQDQLEGTDARLVTLTVDPEYDTPEKLRDYAEAYKADPERWLFLTGTQEEIYDLIIKSFKMPVQEMKGKMRKPGYQFLHTTNILHIDAQGRVRGKYNALEDAQMAALRRVLEGNKPPQVDYSSSSSAKKSKSPQPNATEAEEGKGSPAKEAQTEENTDKKEENSEEVPAWVWKLPTVNAGLNGLSTILLLTGLAFIKQKRVRAHRNTMLAAFSASILFLVCYLVYHFALHHYTGSGSQSFAGTGPIRTFYLGILITHVVLAAAVPFLAIATIYRAYKKRWQAHRRLARVTFPIWVYVSVTGVIIYAMLYHWPVAA